ncbi:hypothetical protein MMC09_004693, partial [Bachmanniomyces sp. S44760]|nr:hypothetical protein [Bachmanniomyces sp. S44760]
HPQIQPLLITEGATQTSPDYNDEGGEPALLLPENPADRTISQTLTALYLLTSNTEKWRSDFKKIPRKTQETRELVTKELAHFPASKGCLQNHSKDNSGILDKFKTWVTSEGNKVKEADDDFKAWEKGLKSMVTTGKTAKDKDISTDTIRGIHLTEHPTLRKKLTPLTALLA